MASCFSEYAVQISDSTSCSSINDSCISPSPNLVPSIQNEVTCMYRTVLSTQKQFSITVSWSRNSLFRGLNINFGQDSRNPFKLNTNSRSSGRSNIRGSKWLEVEGLRVEMKWDLTGAKYESGPEPVEGSYYVLVTVDSEVWLALGDEAKRDSRGKKLFWLVSRQEHYSGNTRLYSTKARFCEKGVWHHILIRCSGEKEEEEEEEEEGRIKYPVLWVWIDKKMVIRVKRLRWNFRGNRTIFLDGLLVDLMWDVHDWFYHHSGTAVFMFRARNGILENSRLWLHQDKEDYEVEFSFIIYACN